MLAVLLAAAAVASGTVVSTAHNATLKTDILVTGSGMTLYEFEGFAGLWYVLTPTGAIYRKLG